VIPNETKIRSIIKKYADSFAEKAYNEENEERDVLMDVFGLAPEIKRENRQYWGRELGMCWQLLVTELFKATVHDFLPAYREGKDELCDLIAGKEAIDTKYRIGSGDSGTLKKFKQYGARLTDAGFRPVLLIVRTDNLRAAIGACEVGKWQICTGDETFKYIRRATKVDLKEWLISLKNEFHIIR